MTQRRFGFYCSEDWGLLSKGDISSGKNRCLLKSKHAVTVLRENQNGIFEDEDGRFLAKDAEAVKDSKFDMKETFSMCLEDWFKSNFHS